MESSELLLTNITLDYIIAKIQQKKLQAQVPKLQGSFPVNARYPSLYYIVIELHLFIITIIYCKYSIFS